MIGNENVARLHEKDGDHLLAALNRLSNQEALSLLCLLSGYLPQEMADFVELIESTREPAAS